MTDFQAAVVRLLREEYPEALIVTEEIAAGMKKPCFQVICGEITLRKEMGRRWRKEEKLQVYWYPPDGEEPQDRETGLQMLLRTAARGVATMAEREKGRLKLTLSLSQILFMDEEEAALMKKMLLALSEEGSINEDTKL